MSEIIEVDGAVGFACGPSSSKCKCNCLEGGTCEHVWDGPMVKPDRYSSTATCSRCGEWAMNHDMWVAP